MAIKTLDNINIANKLVLLRIDINSPVVNGKILENPRFEAAAGTIKELIAKKAKIAIIAHQGRKGDTDFLSLEQHAKILSKYVKANIRYIDSLFEESALKAIKELKSGETILLKNVREYVDEKLPFKKGNHYQELCRLFNLYINDAFSVSHRAQGSIVLPPKYLTSVIGKNFESELKALEKFRFNKNNKITLLLGGAKVEDLLPLFNLLRYKQNKILASGILANLLLIAKGYNLGYEENWLREKSYFSLIPKLKKLYKKYQSQIILPIDFGLNLNNKRINSYLEEAPFKNKICDVGNKTIKLFKQNLLDTNFIFMKGPLGFSEIPEFSIGTKEILTFLSMKTKNKEAFTLLGGGHLTTTLERYKLPKTFSYISLSGGALIAYISGEKLPGLLAIEKSRK